MYLGRFFKAEENVLMFKMHLATQRCELTIVGIGFWTPVLAWSSGIVSTWDPMGREFKPGQGIEWLYVFQVEKSGANFIELFFILALKSITLTMQIKLKINRIEMIEVLRKLPLA
jgi:hypothetical protein